MRPRLLAISSFLFLILLLTGCGGTSGITGKNDVQVTETDFHINSTFTSFTPGTNYHFIVTNTGKTAHEFMIMPKSEGKMSGMPMGNMDKMALASIGNVNPGETKTLDYTFPASATGSRPELACYLPGHYEAGMKQNLTVN